MSETTTDIETEAPADAVAATAVRYHKSDKSLGDLRAEAAELGIETEGLGRQALTAAIAAVRQALANLPAGTAGDDDLRADELGEPLGPQNARRIPMGARAARLTADERPGFYRRWINNVPGRVERAQRAGYNHVKDASGKPISTPAGVQEQGGGMRAYLMELPIELRNEDLEAKSLINDEIDAAVNRGKFNEQADDQRYVPDTGIAIKNPARRARQRL